VLRLVHTKLNDLLGVPSALEGPVLPLSHLARFLRLFEAVSVAPWARTFCLTYDLGDDTNEGSHSALGPVDSSAHHSPRREYQGSSLP
jgi:hypothetical protein